MLKNERLKVSSRYHGSIIIYGCTTKEVIAVRLKGVVTRLSRGADCSQQTC